MFDEATAYEKAKRVITSCITIHHLNAAHRYVGRFESLVSRKNHYVMMKNLNRRLILRRRIILGV